MPRKPTGRPTGRPRFPEIPAVTDADGPVVLATTTGTRLDTLLAIRLHLANTIDAGPSPRDLAALSLRLLAVDAEVRALQEENDPVAVANRLPAEEWTP